MPVIHLLVLISSSPHLPNYPSIYPSPNKVLKQTNHRIRHYQRRIPNLTHYHYFCIPPPPSPPITQFKKALNEKVTLHNHHHNHTPHPCIHQSIQPTQIHHRHHHPSSSQQQTTHINHPPWPPNQSIIHILNVNPHCVIPKISCHIPSSINLSASEIHPLALALDPNQIKREGGEAEKLLSL